MIWFRLVALCVCASALAATCVAGENEEKIRKALGEKTRVEFIETPLAEVIDYFASRHKIDIKLDRQGLMDAAIDPKSTPITFSTIGDISLRSALNLILNDLDLASAIDNEVLIVTTKEKAAHMLHTRVYDVRDLAIPAKGPQQDPDFDSIIEMLTSTVAPHSWNELGGPASIEGFEKNGIVALVISQTEPSHEQIEKLLADLRKLKPVDRN